VAQIITAVNGTATNSTCDVISALHPYKAGDTVHLSVEQSTVNTNAIVVPGKTVVESVVLGKVPRGTPASPCPGVSGPLQGYLGVSLETFQSFTYPFPVTIDTSEIGGPSAGLAMTLGILDKLTNGSLTGGKTIAATGTIDEAGDVGDVGGVPQKTVAVERGGATIFLVPPEEVAAAKSKATASLQVDGVSTLSQALAVLKRAGGTLPTTPHPTSVAAAAG
jgi:Lon-like protease